MLNRRTVLSSAALAGLPLALPELALAQGRKDSIVIAMTLEPPGLDPTAGAASAIAEITHYNIFETLTKIHSDGSVTPLLAERWEVSPDSSQVAVMRPVALDLSQAVLTSTETVMRTFALMGAIKVVVPEGVHVVSNVVAIMGNAVDPPHSDPPPGAPVIKFEGFAFMGEVKIERTVRRELGR